MQTLDATHFNCEIYKIDSDIVNYEIENLTMCLESEKDQKLNIQES